MNADGKCKECGTAIPADSPGGFCAQCLLRLALEKTESLPADHQSPGRIIAPLREKPGDQIGRYRLLQEIGHGGCGVVYMAEQEEPVRRKVALKVIKLGMDTRQVVARFEAERQALALMDHPNIAKVLDAGATETGRPYFVMELVGGIKITDYCNQHQLATRQRLDLFIQVCKAIQHAHQKGIIHRDIKPSNVLVAEQDGVPVPKVIDFGIAKATQGKLTDQTLFTAFEQFLGTPAYMSPEQAQLGGLDVDTRSDIYSLGVLLYELLTGTTPFDTKELVAAGLDEMRRTIREVEPVKPSTRLIQELNSKSETRGAKSEIKSALHTPRSAIDKDLDWIVMKCLEKDRARRYETAIGLATDIERHLQSEPVLASPPSKLYRFQKAVRRNKTALTLGAAVTVLLVAGVVASTWQAWRATQAERRATKEAAKSEQIGKILTEMLASVGPSKALGRDTTMMREILDKTAQRIRTELTNQAEVEITVRQILARTYEELGLFKEMDLMSREQLRLAQAQFGSGDIAVANALHVVADAQFRLGEYDKAEDSARAALEIHTKLGSNKEALGVMSSLGTILHSRSKLAEAEAMHREVLAATRRVLGNEHVHVAEALGTLSFVLWQRGNLTEAEDLARQSLTMLQKLQGGESPTVATAFNNLALVLDAQAKPAEAEAFFREALEMRQKLLGDDHPEVAQSLCNVAGALNDQGKLADAEVAIREALRVSRKAFGNVHPDVAYELNTLAGILREQGKLADTEVTLRESLAIRRELLGSNHIDIAVSLNNLAVILVAESKLADAEVTHQEALAIRRKLLGDNHPLTAQSLANLAFVLEERGKLSDAEVLFQEALAIQRAVFSSNHPAVTRGLHHLARLLLRKEEFEKAEVMARECLAQHEQQDPDDWVTFDVKLMLGSSLLGQTNYADAEPILLSSYEGLKQREAKIPAAFTGCIEEALQALVQLYNASGRPEQASVWKKKLEDIQHAQPTSVAPDSPTKPAP